MGEHDGAHDRQAQPGATVQPRPAGIDTIKAIKNTAQMFWRDGFSLIGHRQGDATALRANSQAYR